MLKHLAISLSVALVARVAAAQEPPQEAAQRTTEPSAQTRADDPRRLRFSIPATGRVGAGVMDGYLTLHGRAAFLFGAVDVTPTVSNRVLRIRVPIGLRHRQAFGTPWTESYGDGAIALRYSPVRRFRAEVTAGATARLRKAWLDQYQPTSVDQLSRTHRYSRWSRFVEAEFAGMPVRRHHARLSYRYSYTDFWADPNYDPYVRPTHLVPQDRTEHLLDASWHYLRDGVRVGVELVARHRNYYFSFARVAGSGATHATAGGAPPNPLYRVWFAEPTVDARLDPSARTRIRLAYGHEVQVDTYQGYFSFQGPHPAIELELRPLDALEISLGADVRWRRYGPGSFQAVSSHPALESGSRRYAHRYHASVDVRYEMTEHVSVYADASLVVRSSNRPDYQPGVYPTTQVYDIDFDYTNLRATIGVRFSR